MFISLNCLVMAMILFTAEGIERSWCPIACDCRRGTIAAADINCPYGFWNRLPTLYKNYHLFPTVIKMQVKNGNFGKLEKPQNCQMYNKLKSLKLDRNMISAVAKDAFSCMPDMEHLALTHGELTEFWPDTFAGLQKLITLNLAHNNITPKLFTEICKLQKLTELRINDQKMMIHYRDLKCIEDMDALLLIDVSRNTFLPPVQRVLQTFRRLNTLFSSGCNISNLDEYSFDGFVNIALLSLQDNSIKNIAKSTFSNLTYLKVIDLSYNLITNTDLLNFPHMLKSYVQSYSNLKTIPKLPKELLNELILNYNNFSIIPHGFLVGMPRLSFLYMTSSHISKIKKSAFQDLPMLDMIDLQNNPIVADSINNLFASFANTSLHRVLFRLCNLPQVDVGLFQDFRNNELKELQLVDCKIRKIDPRAFLNLGRLLKLRLARNQMSRIYNSTFSGMKKLELLDLSSNRIYELDKNAFYGLDNLEMLYLGNNHLTTFHGDMVGPSSWSLKLLDLHENNIRRLPTPLRGMTNLQTLIISHNKLTHLPTDMFNATKELQRLDLSNNNIESVMSNVFVPLQKLKGLLLQNNKIPPRFIFKGGVSVMKNLSIMDISYNEVARHYSLNISFFMKYLSNLERVEMSNCGLTGLQPGMCGSLSKLDFLDCNHNDISFIEPTAFKGAINLRKMLLVGNKIRYIDHNSFRHLPNLRELYLANNPLVCSCEALWIVQAVKTELIYIGSSGLSSLRCDAPPEHRRATVESIHLRLTDCEQDWIKMLWPMVGSLASLIAVAFVLIVWKYHWHMKYLIFLIKAGIRGYREFEDDQDYEYDAFIAYSVRDLEWVKKEMLPNIDKDYLGDDGFKLCIHERDWLAGVDIVSNIVTSIETSRRTIVVLSNAFAASQWCQFELATAQLKLDADGTSRDILIIILLNDIDANLLTPRLRCILASKTYLPWSNDVDKQHLFWKALIKSLKKPAPIRPGAHAITQVE